MSDEKQRILLVVRPGAKINKATLQAMDAAGFIVVRGDPEDFTVIGNHPPMSDPLVLQAALNAIRDYSNNFDQGNPLRSRFGRELATALGYGETVRLK